MDQRLNVPSKTRSLRVFRPPGLRRREVRGISGARPEGATSSTASRQYYSLLSSACQETGCTKRKIKFGALAFSGVLSQFILYRNHPLAPSLLRRGANP